MFGQLKANGQIINLCSLKLDGFEELPDGANVGDFVKDGKIVPRMDTELARTAAAARATRDSLLVKHVDRFNAIRFESLNGEKQKAWIEYRQALLNVPQQEGFPFDISWPTPPEE